MMVIRQRVITVLLAFILMAAIAPLPVRAGSDTVDSQIQRQNATQFLPAGRHDVTKDLLIPRHKDYASTRYSVALSGDGNTALVGANSFTAKSRAYILVRSGEMWKTEDILIPDTPEIEIYEYGNHVALSADGNTAFVTGEIVDADWVPQGHFVAIFGRKGTTWVQQSKIPNISGYLRAIKVSTDGNMALLETYNAPVSEVLVLSRSGTTWTQQGRLDCECESVVLSGDGDTIIGKQENQGIVFVRSGAGWVQQAVLGAKDDELDYTRALSADGNTALILASRPVSGETINSAYVFTRSGTTWTQQARLAQPDVPAGDEFRYSFAINGSLSADGNTAALNTYDDYYDIDHKVYLYTRSAGEWKQTQILQSDNPRVGDQFGASLALDRDGKTLLVATVSEDNNVGPIPSRTVHVFAQTPIGWNRQAKLLSLNDDSKVGFASKVTVSADGNTALIAAPNETRDGKPCTPNLSREPLDCSGAIYMFVRSGSAWVRQARFTTVIDEPLGLGGSIALSADGNTAVVGQRRMEYDTPNQAYIFVRSGDVWRKQVTLSATTTEEVVFFGATVALSADGNTAIIGEDGYGNYTARRGALFVFTRTGESWTQQERLVAEYPIGSISVSADGNVVLGRAFLWSKGASYIFTRRGTAWTEPTQITTPTRKDDDYNEGSAVLSPNGKTAYLTGAHYFAPDDPGVAIYIFTPNGDTWETKSKLVVPEDRQNFPHSAWLRLSGDGNTLLFSGGRRTPDGLIYIFRRNGAGWTRGKDFVTAQRVEGRFDGNNVALNGDGRTLLLGVLARPLGGVTYDSYLQIYIRPETDWKLQTELRRPAP